MSDSFRDRMKAFEAKFQIDEEQAFKIRARANKKLGLWAADKLGLSGDRAAAYALDVVDADFQEPGIEDVIHKVQVDFTDKGIGIDSPEIRKQLHLFEAKAHKEIVRD
jgi:hypothetical protein